jgi:hypothetical protein
MAHQCPDGDYETEVELARWEHWNEVRQPTIGREFIHVGIDADCRRRHARRWGPEMTTLQVALHRAVHGCCGETTI